MPLGGMIALGAGSAVAGVAGPIIGSIASSGDKQKAADALNAAQQYISTVQLPPDQSRPIIIKYLQDAGVWKPEMEQTISAGIAQASQVQEDPALRQQQMATLSALQQISQTGMTATGRAQFNQARLQAQQDIAAKNAQILQQMQQRGMAGSGAELAMQLSAAQSGANEEASAADRIAAQQEQAKMSALGQLGGLAGSVRAQDFSNVEAKAKAADAFKMFDVQNQIAQQQRNVAAQNQAAQYNVMNKQRVSDLNAQLANQEALRERQGEELNYQNQLGLAQTKANAALGQAGQYQQQAQNTAQGWQNIGQGVSQGLATGAALYGRYGGKSAAPTSSMGDGTPVDLSNEAQFTPSSGGALQGPALPSGDYSTSESPWYEESLAASQQ